MSQAQVINRPPAAKKAVHIYTDGACVGNPGPMGIGIVIWDPHACGPDAPVREIAEYIGKGTNNIAELTAIKRGLATQPRDRPVLIYTDSTYAIGVLSQDFRVKANQSLVAGIKRLIEEFQHVQFVKVPAHSGVAHNERADKLARDAAFRRSNAPAPDPARAPGDLLAEGGKVAVLPGVSALAARIEWLFCTDHKLEKPPSEQAADDKAWRHQRYGALKSSSLSFEESFRAANTEWLERVIGEFLAEQKRGTEAALERVLCVDMPGSSAVQVRRVYREVVGPDAFNDGWIAAFEQGGDEAVMNFCEAFERQKDAIPW